MKNRKMAALKKFEGQSGTMLATAFAMCDMGEEESNRSGPTLPQQALTAVAVSLRETVKAFAVVAKVSNQPND